MALRVSLLLIGCIIVLVIYLFSRRALPDGEPRSRKPFWSGLRQRVRARVQRDSETVSADEQQVYPPVAPMLDADELEQLGEMIPERGAGTIKTEEAPPIIELGSEQIAPAGEQLFIPLTIMARAGQQINGDTIRQATQMAGLVLKEDGVYRFEVKDAQGYKQPLLGLANILEPGSFDAEHIEQLATPGLVLYLHLPAPIEAREAFESLIEVGHKLEELLGAELCDESRSVLTKQTIGHLKEKVEAFRFKQKMTQLQRRRP